MEHVIGVDIGTTHCKALLIGRNGRVVDSARRGYDTQHPQPGYHEQDPEEIFRATVDVIKEVALQGKHIKAVCFSAAMHSLMAVDKSGNPLTPVMTWADTRSNELVLALKGSNAGDYIYTRTGTPLHAMSPLFKIAWLRDHSPEVFREASKFISIKEYVTFRLFGEYVVDHSMASASGLFDIHTGSWLPQALAFAGIRPEQLSAPVLPDYQYGALKNEELLQAGLSADTAFFAGGSDGCMANIGGGAISAEEPALTIGTSGAIRRLISSPHIDSKQRLFSYRFNNHLYLCGGAINNGGLLLHWFVETFMDKEQTFQQQIESLMRAAAPIPAGSEGLVFLPYIYGERAPIWDAAATGTFHGISSRHTRAHFFRAMLEGVAFSLLQVLEAMEENGEAITLLHAGGGFIESQLWIRIIADVLNKPLAISRAGDSSAIGAGLVAMEATGWISSLQAGLQLLDKEERVEPDQRAHVAYLHNYSIYKTLYRPR